MFAGCAPGVFTSESRTWFQSMTGWPDTAALRTCSAGTRDFMASVCEVRAYAPAARTPVAPKMASASPSVNSRRENRFIAMLLVLWVVASVLRSWAGYCLFDERTCPSPKVASISTEEHEQRVVARRREDAANLVASEQLPAEVA